jgi:hypothetical protein
VPRRIRHRQDLLSQSLDKVKQKLGSSPLSFVYPKVEEVVLTLQQDLQKGIVGQDVADQLSSSIAGTDSPGFSGKISTY